MFDNANKSGTSTSPYGVKHGPKLHESLRGAYMLIEFDARLPVQPQNALLSYLQYFCKTRMQHVSPITWDVLKAFQEFLLGSCV
jgi:hypothetical protein